MENFDLGKKISSLRKNNSMTQKELASLLHISDKVISKWELNQSEPDINSLKSLSHIFNISINELLGQDKEQEKISSNEKVYFFFKKYYIPLIECILCLFALIDICVGYSILKDDIPDYGIGILIGFSIAFVLLQLYILLINSKSITIKVLKIINFIILLGFLAINIAFIVLIKNNDFKHFYVVGLVQTSLMLIAIIFDCLHEFNILKSCGPLKLGKIVFVLLIVFIGLQCGFIIGNITTSSVIFADEKYEQETPVGLKFENDEIVFYHIGETFQLKFEYEPDYSRKENVTFYSDNENIATVNENGLITACSYGETEIFAYCGNVSERIDVDIKNIELSKDEAIIVYSGNQNTQIAISPIDSLVSVYYANKDISFIITDENGNLISDIIEIKNYEINEDLIWWKDYEMVLNLNINYLESTNAYYKLLVFDHALNRYTYKATFNVVDISSIDFQNIDFNNLCAGEIVCINTTYSPSNVKNPTFTYHTDNTDIAEIIDGNKLLIKTLGTFTLTATTHNGISKRQIININRYLRLNSVIVSGSNGIGKKIIEKVSFESGKIPYSTTLKCDYSGSLTFTDSYEKDGAYYFEFTATSLGKGSYLVYLDSNITGSRRYYTIVDQYEITAKGDRTLSLYKEYYPLTLQFTNESNAQNEGIWYHIESSDSSIVTISGGGKELDFLLKNDSAPIKLIPKSAGTCTITISNEHFNQTYTYTVIPKTTYLQLENPNDQNLTFNINETENYIINLNYDAMPLAITKTAFKLTGKNRCINASLNYNEDGKCYILLKDFYIDYVHESISETVTISTVDDEFSITINVTLIKN